MFMTSIGLRIKAAREEKRLSQAELGKRCGWTDAQSRISNYEQDIRTKRMTVEDASALAAALEVHPGWILFGGPNKKGGIDAALLGQYLEKMDQIFPDYGLNKLSWHQKAALAKIGYDMHAGIDAPNERTVTAEVIQWAQAFRASGGS